MAKLHLDRPPPAGLERSAAWLARWWLPLLLLLGAALYLPFLGARPLRFEEGRRALQALEILAGGSWWHLQVLGEPYLAKPPLLPWLMAITAEVRGELDEVAVRLPAVLSVLWGAAGAGGLARVLAPERGRLAALAAGVAFFSCAYVFTKARLGETDTLVTVFCGTAFSIWIWGRQAGRLSLPIWLGVCSFLAASAFTKGPIPLAFPAIPLLLIPLLQRQWGEFGLAAAVLVLAFLPLGVWVWLNLPETGLQGWMGEMRVAGRGGPPADYWWHLLHLNQVPNALIYTLPWCIPAALSVASRRRALLGENWPILALLLYAVPFAVFVLLTPEARPRYAMPIAWPVAVLAGLWIAAAWQHRRLPAIFLIGGFLFIVVHQAIVLGIFEGRTDSQRAFRARTDALAAAVAPLSSGRIYLFDSAREPDHNSLSYAGRPLQRDHARREFCPAKGRYLLVSARDRETADASPYWRLKEDIAESWMGLYERTPKSCPPA
ncbi:MAG: glycosyltransferase family 39 protein [Rhodospirillales bacterium]|nr:glycosyltransferase family 39 protein [Rhodospirillales bacterium]